MLRILTVILFIFSIPSWIYAQDSNPKQEKVRAFLSRFEGRWQCEGAFIKNGRPIEATVTFTSILEGKALRFEQINHSPNEFHGMGFWSFDSLSKTLTNIAVYTNPGTPSSYSNLFIGHIENDSTMTFTADTLVAPPFTKHRYLYQIKAKDKYKVQWQIYANEAWQSYDYLNCEKFL